MQRVERLTAATGGVLPTIGEALEGSEAAFARRMNRTAKALGMTRTTFKNAHGLTEDGHLSTARDMTILGRKLFYQEAKVLAGLKHPLVIGFATDNPLVALYSAMKALRQQFGVDRRVSETVAPFGVIALLADVIGSSGVGVLASLVVYCVGVLVGLTIHTVVVRVGPRAAIRSISDRMRSALPRASSTRPRSIRVTAFSA